MGIGRGPLAEAAGVSLARMFDHTAQVWRSTSSQGATYGEEVREWAKVGSPVKCGVRRPSAVMADAGPGVAPIGERVIYLFPDTNIQARDVIQLLTGPDAVVDPPTFEVDSPPTRPRGHHVETRCRHFIGKLE